MGPKTLANRVDRLKRKAAKVQSQGTTRSALQTQLDTAAVSRQWSLPVGSEVTNRPILTARHDGPPPPEAVRPPPPPRPVPLPGFLQGLWQAAPPSRIPTKQSQRIVAPRRLPQAPQIVTIPRRTRPRTLSPRRKPTNWTGYGGSNELRAVLGLTSQRGALDDAPVLVAVDTESEKRGLINHVVEVGVTILRVRDIWNLEPGPHLRNWIPKMKHFHVVLDITRRPKLRMRSSLFGPSQFLGPIEAQAAVKKFLRDCMGIDNQQPVTGSTAQPSPPPVYLVGQSVEGDVAALRGPGVRLDISDPATVGVRFHKLFDTYMFSQAIQGYGAPLPTAKLGWAVRYLGVDPTYVDPDIHGTVIGTHNAVNDAAYTMMTLCFYALRWEELSNGVVLEPTSATSPRKGKASSSDSAGTSAPHDVAQFKRDMGIHGRWTSAWRRYKARTMLATIGAGIVSLSAFFGLPKLYN
ncbi:hypothetical protein KC318_g5603 [Hortaea werneckii]|uniref:Gfd2/YDR514C-like C-terminal domain-containing protein n=1 Tax=Hortaea werneckii TaxID=91943 RepID=A0A3M7A7V4_HORWE|nr:hypothetical protein KC334_g6366 [Hortaea werneckii]KAI7010407.1 hypothetical protein KC355_g6194 [Hortaea werneckii]KAI7667857.1 hypothetical protein KC318_g5603 [Hortaea werneckii]RMY23528.1 hypothetical protein D0867_01995 [Hortaea werneckii]RMY39259.1 hypothetical protein D0866_02050 [Hortaea werneckii]